MLGKLNYIFKDHIVIPDILFVSYIMPFDAVYNWKNVNL